MDDGGASISRISGFCQALNLPLFERRERLDEIFKNIKAAPITQSESLDATPRELVRVAKEFGFEGIVAKRKDSVYESGKRTGAWVKYKVNRGQEFVVGGYTPGNPFDALIVGYYAHRKWGRIFTFDIQLRRLTPVGQHGE